MTLTDDETGRPSITLTTSPTSVLESASGTTVTVATLGGSATRPSATDVVVSVGGGTRHTRAPTTPRCRTSR